jgi:pantoate--beta-alanine ligase
MVIIKKIDKMAHLAARIKSAGESIALVPTMGALHEGHLSLIRQASKDCDKIVVSIFVNPIQFGPQEDFRQYPRNLSRDARLCRQVGTDVIFLPAASKMYPADYRTSVEVGGLSNLLCGKARPAHFKGVTTVVNKLFNIVQPDIAYFGQKDAQQAIIIRKMVTDLNLPVEIKLMPTVREKDGLAMSSRNVYLDKTERKDALVLSQALELARKMFRHGQRSAVILKTKMRQLIESRKNTRIDYIAIVEQGSLQPVRRVAKGNLIALAVFVGKTRLIDNLIVR